MNNKIAKHDQKITFSRLINFEIVEQWHLCQANFIYPCLVLFSNPAIFLVVILFFTILGVVIAFKKREMRINSIILSLYPFLFHICFMIFYWVSSVNIIIITQIVCLGIYFLGVIHHSLTLFYEIAAFVIHFIRKSIYG